MEGGKDQVEKKGGSLNDAVIHIAEIEEAPVTEEKSGSQCSARKIEHISLNTDEIISGSASPDKPAQTARQFLIPKKPVLRTGDLQHDDKKLMHSPCNPTVMRSRYDYGKKKEKKTNKIKKIFEVIELIAFVCVMALLISSLTVTKLKNHLLWGRELWKWCVLVSVIFCGRLVTKRLMIALICFIKKSFRLKLMVLYYVDGLRRSVRAFIWFGLVLLAWSLLVECGVEMSKETSKIINYVTRGLVACLVGTVLWMIKTYSFKLLVASRLSETFFDQIQEAMFNEFVIYACSGPALRKHKAERTPGVGKMENETGKPKEKKKEEATRPAEKHKKMKRISAWTMAKLINHICSTELSYISQLEKKIGSEGDASEAANLIFQNVARPGSEYIEEEDFLRFLTKEDVHQIIQKMGEKSARVSISRSDVEKSVLNVYEKRESLAHCLNNSKEAMQELNKLFTGIVMVLIIIVWLLIVGLITTKVLLLILSQLLLAVFLFGNTAKNVFEAIIFLFVTHPFDVGDHCVIDGAQMVVEEMHILTTTFLRYDSEKIFYPNSVLATKPISNFKTSPVDMKDAVEFSIDASTPENKITDVREKIKKYLKNKSHWNSKHSVVVKQIKDEKMIMCFYVAHSISFGTYETKVKRRSELVLRLKKIFEKFRVKIYHVLPQEVHGGYVGSATSLVPLPAK